MLQTKPLFFLGKFCASSVELLVKGGKLQKASKRASEGFRLTAFRGCFLSQNENLTRHQGQSS